jgi:hypothetical protein
MHAINPVLNTVKDRVQKIWDDASMLRPELFDGKVLCVQDVDSHVMVCYPVPYRYIYAQDRDSELAAQMNLRAAAVSGVVRLNGKVFVGRRSSSVTQGSGKFELVPSGGLPAQDGEIDYRSQLLLELAEEAHIEPEMVDSILPFAVIEDRSERVLDICCEIVLRDAHEKALLENFRAGEYEALYCFSPAEIKASIEAAPESWLPTSACIVSYLYG